MRSVIKNMSGGLCDTPYNNPDNKMVTCENLLPTTTDGLKTRDGSIAYSGASTQASRIDSIFNFQGTDYVQCQGKIFPYNSTTSLKMGSKLSGSELVTNGNFTSITGWTGFGAEGWSNPSNNAVQDGTGGTTGIYRTDIPVVKGEKYCFSIDVTRTGGAGTGAIKVRLGTYPTFGFNWAFQSERPGTDTGYYPYDYYIHTAILEIAKITHKASFEATATGNMRFEITSSSGVAFVLDNVSIQKIVEDTIELLPSTTAPLINYIKTDDEIHITNTEYARPIKMWIDNYQGLSTLKKSSSGLPEPASLTAVATSIGDTHTYNYAIIYRYNYVTGTNKEKSDFSSPYILTAVTESLNEIGTGGGSHVVLTLPTLTNAAGDGWDVSNVIIEIYRTKDTGSVFYAVGRCQNGQVTFNDAVLDSDVGSIAYFSLGGVYDDVPPKAKYISAIGNTAFYFNIYRPAFTGWYVKNYSAGYDISKIYQSQISDPDSVPEDFWVSINSEIMGASTLQAFNVCFTTSPIYRIEGLFNEDGSGGMNPIEIHSSAGCVGHQSIVKANDLLFWAGADGFYTTDGFQCKKLPLNNPTSINTYYKSIISETSNTLQQERIYGSFDYKNNRIYWCINDDQAISDNNKIMVYDITKDSFFLLVGASTFTPTAIEFNSTGLVRCTATGYIFQHQSTSTTDTTGAIISKLKTVAYDFGDPCNVKYVSDCIINASNNGSLTATVKSYDDGDTTGNSLEGIAFTSAGDGKKIIKTNRMNGSSMRCNHKQLYIETTGGVLELDSIAFNYEMFDKRTPSQI